MPEPCLLDNDIILKVAAFKLTDDVLSLLTIESEKPAILGVGRFVVARKAETSKRFNDSLALAASIEAFLDQLNVVEPNDDELELAADLEATGIQEGVDLDVGEAQLLAVLLNRSSPAIATGDKRAVIAISRLGIARAYGKFVCLEQLFTILLQRRVTHELRAKVCAEPGADRAISLCFACASISTTLVAPDSIAAGLQSYIANLRAQSGSVLMLDGTVGSLAS